MSYAGGVLLATKLKPIPAAEVRTHRFYRALHRVFPDCITLTQAVAFNMFLTLSPMILVIFAAMASYVRFRLAFEEIIARMRIVLPPEMLSFLSNFLVRHTSHPWRLVLVGLGGMILAGTQMMKLFMEGFRTIYGKDERLDVVPRHVRALLLLTATIVPSIVLVNFVVFGRQVRNSMLHTSSMPLLVRAEWAALYIVVCLFVAWIVLTFIYRVGRPGYPDWVAHMPGAAVATGLWWIVSIALGFYLRHVPYSLVYGGLAATIGLMIWTQLTATIVLIGAAYNAELES